jgi:hypothetical protein
MNAVKRCTVFASPLLPSLYRPAPAPRFDLRSASLCAALVPAGFALVYLSSPDHAQPQNSTPLGEMVSSPNGIPADIAIMCVQILPPQRLTRNNCSVYGLVFMDIAQV